MDNKNPTTDEERQMDNKNAAADVMVASIEAMDDKTQSEIKERLCNQQSVTSEPIIDQSNTKDNSSEESEPIKPEIVAKDALKDTNTDLAVAQSELETALEAQKNLPNDASDDEKKTAQERVTAAEEKVKSLTPAAEGGRRRSRRRNNKKSAKKSAKRGGSKSAKKGGKKHRKSAKKGAKKRSYRKH